MSDTDVSAPEDPLRALRAQDHRPPHEVWRSRIRDWLANRSDHAAPTDVRPWLLAVLAVPVVMVVAWQSYIATEPPVESTLPLASHLASEGGLEVTTSVAVRVDGDGSVSPSTDPAAGVVVHVAGAVHTPGLVVGEVEWRVNDAVEAAGGAAVNADLDRVNLAAPLVDGERLFIPEVGEDVPELAGSFRAGNAASQDPVVDVNAADQGQLESLPGIGPVTALAIIDHRAAHGAFANVDALVAVRGIGPATVDQLRDYVRVGA